MKAVPEPGYAAEFFSSACSEIRPLLGLRIQEKRAGIPHPKYEIPVLERTDDLLAQMVTSQFLVGIQRKLSPGVSSSKTELKQVLPDHILHLSWFTDNKGTRKTPSETILIRSLIYSLLFLPDLSICNSQPGQTSRRTYTVKVRAGYAPWASHCFLTHAEWDMPPSGECIVNAILKAPNKQNSWYQFSNLMLLFNFPAGFQ